MGKQQLNNLEKQTFDFIKQQYTLETHLYHKLEEKGFDADQLYELFEELDDFREKTLRIGKHLDKEKYLNIDTHIIEDYEDVQKYIKFNLIYEYESGMVLCENTAGTYHLIPKSLLACNQE